LDERKENSSVVWMGKLKVAMKVVLLVEKKV
jgi:hypothetical protein